MVITHKDFHKLNFPLFTLPSNNWWRQDKVLFLDLLVLDDRNMPGKTLGLRRLQCGRKDLLSLRRAVFSPVELIRCGAKFFIDNLGNTIVYEKTYNAKIKTYRIKRVERKEVASLLWLYEVETPFTLKRPPIKPAHYARMLEYNGVPWIVYEYILSKKKDTYVKI